MATNVSNRDYKQFNNAEKSNLKDETYNYNMNFRQIPKSNKEKLFLPPKGLTYLKNLGNIKNNLGNKIQYKAGLKSNYESNIILLNRSNQNNFKRSFSINNSRRQTNDMDNLGYSDMNFNPQTGNYADKNILFDENNYKNYNSFYGQNSRINASRSKSNGRSNNSLNNPMINLLKSYTSKNKHETPPTYRKYRIANNKSSDKICKNTVKYPVHINPNHSNEINNNYNNFNQGKNPNNYNSVILVNEKNISPNVNLTKYNNYQYYNNHSSNRSKYRKNNNGVTNNQSSASKKKKSFNVLSDILDSHFSINSPNEGKVIILNHHESDHKNGKNTNADDINISNSISPHKSTNQNLNRSINNTHSNNDIDQNLKDKNIYEQNAKMTINFSYLGENPIDRFLEALEHIMTTLDPIFGRLSFTEQLEKFIENTEDHRRSLRLGSLVAIYIMLNKYQIDEIYKTTILEKIISLMHNFEIQEELFLVACLEIAGLFAPNELLYNNINLISMFLTDFNFPRLQHAAFNCLMLMEYDGIKALVDLASKDFRDYTRYILKNLVKTPHIQKAVIVRALINEIYSNHPDKRHAALAALNRMHDLVTDDDTLNKLAYFFKDQKIEKIFLASTLRTSGEKGEKILLKELKSNNDFSVKVAIASVLAYRTSKYPNYLDIRLDKNDSFSIAKTLPGSFCSYYGKISPYVYEKIFSEQEKNDKINKSFNEANNLYEEFLEVNTRDFLAALQRLVSINYNHQKPKLVHKGNHNIIDDLDILSSKNDVLIKYVNFFLFEKDEMGRNQTLVNKRVENSNEEFSQSKRCFPQNDNNFEEIINENKFLNDAVEISKNYISEEVIKGLCFCLKDYSSAVRETSADSLAHIALPETLAALPNLIESLKDNDIVVRSKVVYAIGRIASGCEDWVIPHLIEALKSNFWKVKLACLSTLAEFGYRAAKQSLPYLQKILRESPINKQAIADTMVKLGYEGEALLLKVATTEDDSNFKLKSVVIKALSHSAITGPNIDFIIETLFKSSNSENSLIRLNSVIAIKNLVDASDESITYLKRKNIIPFYYNKLTDKDLNIQTFAIECIRQLGPQGELIFIEGISKDSNPIIRANCAIGLANCGAHTIRTLLIGLHDENREVRRIVEKEITGKFAVYEILDLFMEKNSQKLSLKIAIRDILEKSDTLLESTRAFFNDLIINLDKDIYKTNNQINYDYSNSKNIKDNINDDIDQHPTGNNQNEEEIEGDNEYENEINNFRYKNENQNVNFDDKKILPDGRRFNNFTNETNLKKN